MLASYYKSSALLLANYEAGAATRYHAHYGRLLAYVQAIGDGAISLSVSAPDLQGGQVALAANQAGPPRGGD